MTATNSTWYSVGWIAEQLTDTDEELVITVDGKSVCDARGADGRAPHLLAAMVGGARAVLAQREIDHKTNEVTAFAPLLEGLDLASALVIRRAAHPALLGDGKGTMGRDGRSRLAKLRANTCLAAERFLPETVARADASTPRRLLAGR